MTRARIFWSSAVAAALLAIAGLPAGAPAQEEGAAPPAAQPADCVRGRDLMTEEEWSAHRAAVKAATSDEARDKIRRENRELVRKRAAEQKKKLCETMQGGGQGPGGGKAPGGPPDADQ